MEGLKKDIQLMRTVIVCIALSSLSLLLATFVNSDGVSALTVISGIIFWGGLIVGYIQLFIISKHRKAYEKNAHHIEKRVKSRPGIITFFSGPAATVADLAMILFFLLTMVFAFIPGFSQTVLLIFIAVLVFAVQMHCILNGVNFKYIKRLAKSKC